MTDEDAAAPDVSSIARLPIAAMIPEPPAAPAVAPSASSRLLVVPEVVAFRPKRTASAAGHAPAAAPADTPDTADTVQTPAPGRVPDSHDRLPPAPHGDTSPWAATEGPAAITDTAV